MKIYYPFLLLLLVVSCKFENSSHKSSTHTSKNQDLLQLHLKKGDTYSIDFSTTQDIGQSILGKKIGIKQQIDIQLLMQVINVDDTSNHFTITYKHLHMNQDAMGKSVSFDSDKPNQKIPAPLQQLMHLKDKQFHVHCGHTGNIIAITDQQEQPISDSTLKNMLESSMHIYPDHAVSEGATWNNEHKNNLNGMAILVNQNTYTLLNQSNEKATLKLQSKVTTIQSEQEKSIMNLEGTQDGELSIDTHTGMIISSEIKQHFNGKVAMQGIKVPIQIEGTVVQKCTKL
ncbi:MAG: DUF6263 family protein [Chitinophagaceae bacterium]